MTCKCSLRTRLVGDGCEVCNPAKSLQYAKETIAELTALVVEAFPVMAARAARHGRKAGGRNERFREFHTAEMLASDNWLDRAGSYYNDAQPPSGVGQHE